MRRVLPSPWRLLGAFLALAILAACADMALRDDPPIEGDFVPTGQLVTPLAAAGADFTPLDPGLPGLPEFRAGQAVALAPSPDGRTLLVLTSGYNRTFDNAGRRVAAASNEYVFVYELGHGPPKQLQTLTIPNTFMGIAWDRDGEGFHVSGGVDDSVSSFRRHDGAFAAEAAPIPLSHADGLGV